METVVIVLSLCLALAASLGIAATIVLLVAFARITNPKRVERTDPPTATGRMPHPSVGAPRDPQ